MRSSRTIQRTILQLLTERAATSTVCPSEVARALDPEDWRPLMEPVRAAARLLVARGDLEILQRGKRVNPSSVVGPIRLRLSRKRVIAPRVLDSTPWAGVDFRKHPELYKVGRGEQGVLTAEPYKSELLPLWRFSTPAIARTSAKALWAAFVEYRRHEEGVGMDMARKFLQMGFTRARRYANHRSGRKYDPTTGAVLPASADPVKAAAAQVFYEVWQRAERDRVYKKWRAAQVRQPRT